MRGIHSRAKCIYLAIPPGIMRGGEEKKKRKTNPSNDKISVRIREKKKKREKRKGERGGEEKLRGRTLYR